MLYSTIVSLISKQLADEIISESEILSYTDRVIDDINAQMNTKFPTFTEVQQANPGKPEYTAIPDKYIRTVVIPGAAFKYYITDEEGSYAAPKYEEDYQQGLFYMLRDFSNHQTELPNQSCKLLPIPAFPILHHGKLGRIHYL